MTTQSKTPPFRKLWKLEYPQAKIKFGREVVKTACTNKEAVVVKERADLLRGLFCKKNSNSGRVTKYDESEHREPKAGPLAQKINSTKNQIAQERIGEAQERLTVFQNRLEADLARTV
jgi:hypothetical protein